MNNKKRCFEAQVKSWYPLTYNLLIVRNETIACMTTEKAYTLKHHQYKRMADTDLEISECQSRVLYNSRLGPAATCCLLNLNRLLLQNSSSVVIASRVKIFNSTRRHPTT